MDVNAAADTLDADARLVARLADGDLDALGTLYQRYGASVRSLLLRVEPTLSQEDAADLCQDTFLALRPSLARYTEQGRLKSWLYGIAIRKADTEAQIAARQRIDRAMRQLPAAQREVLVLHVVEGLTVKQTAEALGVAENAVSTRLYRARKTLEEAR